MSENNNEQESAAGPEQSGNAAEVNEVIIDLDQKDDIEEETKKIFQFNSRHRYNLLFLIQQIQHMNNLFTHMFL